jgi:hypothetical protein
MATEAQIIANRRNAQKSTGPRTPEGKAAVSHNAVKHALLARQAVISSESQADFDLYRDQILDELAPATPMESMLADRIVSLSWRLKRAGRIQNQTIDALNQRPGPVAGRPVRIGSPSGSRPHGNKGLLKRKGARPPLNV